MKKRIFSILLAVVMLLGMIPGTSLTAFAVETPTITVAGFPAPQAGQSVEEWWNSITAAPILTGGLTWGDGEPFWLKGEYDNVEDAAAVINGNGPFGGTFEGGKKYTLVATVVPDGGELPAAATVVASGASNTAYEKHDEIEVAVLFLTYTVGDITVGGFPAPLAGQSVEEWRNCISAPVTLSGGWTWVEVEMFWLEGEIVNIEEGQEALDNNDGPFEGTFEDGKKYTFCAVVELDGGELPAEATVVADGASNTAYEKVDEEGFAALFLTYTAGDITVTGLTAPQAGQFVGEWYDDNYPVFNPDYDWEGGILFEGAFDNIEELMSYTGDPFEGNFVSGRSYTLYLWFVSETPTLPLNATLNVPGATSAVYEYGGEEDDIYYAAIMIVYTAETPTITVDGFPAPQAGQTVEEWRNSISAAPTLTGGWRWVEEEMFWIEGEIVNIEEVREALDNDGPFEGTFEDGKKYTFCAVVGLDDGEPPAEATVVASGASNTAYEVFDEGGTAALFLTYTVPHTCDIKPVAKDEPSCTEGGKEAYYKCEDCGKFYEDALGTKEITDLASWGNLAKLGHTESDWKSDKDNHWKECTVAACGVIIENSKAAHTYVDGKCACGATDPNYTPETNYETAAPETDKPEEPKDDEGGCGSTLALSSLAIVAVVGSALVINKKTWAEFLAIFKKG